MEQLAIITSQLRNTKSQRQQVVILMYRYLGLACDFSKYTIGHSYKPKARQPFFNLKCSSVMATT
jgi:hypothetical protein